jgi:transcriptional regulator with XRE-family HTH domain
VAKLASTVLLGRLGKRIRALRADQKLTQDELAHRCNVSPKYMSELERGIKAPSWDTLVALCKGLNVKFDVLVYAIDDAPNDEPTRIEDLLAGRPREAQYQLLQGMQLVLRAAELKR